MLESNEEDSKALVFFAVSKQIPIVYSADRGRAEKKKRFKACLVFRLRSTSFCGNYKCLETCKLSFAHIYRVSTDQNCVLANNA